MNSTLLTILTKKTMSTRFLMSLMCLALCTPFLKADISDPVVSTSDYYPMSGSGQIDVELQFANNTAEENADLIEFVISPSIAGVTLTHGINSPSPFGGCGSNLGDEITGNGPSWGIANVGSTGSGCGPFVAGSNLQFGLTISNTMGYSEPIEVQVRIVGDGNPGFVNSVVTTLILEPCSVVGAITAIACNDEVQISLDEDCEVTVTPDMILEGGPYGCFDSYTVVIKNENDVVYGNTLTSSNIGQELYVTVTNPAGNSCWGRILLEDKLPAPVDCIPVYTTCSGDLEPGDPVTPNVTYKATLNPINSSLPASGTSSRSIPIEVYGLNGATTTNVAVRFSIAHEAVSDLTATITSPAGVTKTLFLNPGTTCEEDNLQVMINPLASLTAADLADSCAVGMPFAVSGSYQPTDDLSDFEGEDPVGEWTVTITDDNDGNGGMINSIELVIGQSGADISFPTTKDITYIRIDENSFRVDGLDPCGFTTLAYTDNFVTQSCESEFDKVIERTWTSEDESGNRSEECIQLIQVYRSGLEAIQFPRNRDGIDLPVLSCELYGDKIPPPGVAAGQITGELCDIVQIFEPEDDSLYICKNSYKVIRKWKVLQWCSGEVLEHTQIIKVLDEDGPDIENIPDMTVSTDEFECLATVIFDEPTATDGCSDEFTYKLQHLPAINDGAAPEDEVYTSTNVVANRISDLPFGRTWIKWTVTDECGNASYEYFTVDVQDQTAPIPVCDQFTIVSVGGDGKIVVDAISFDDGSHDNCGIRSFEVAKMTDECGFGTAFHPEIEFCCDEINPDERLMVMLRVTDNFGNSNTCMVEVTVQDKLPPYITDCPADITLDCQADYEDFSVTGEPLYVDNCPNTNLTLTNSDSGTINNCGEGIITRTWTVTDEAGLKNSCVQVISLVNDDPFVRTDIDWPNDYEATTCESNLDPMNLPAANAYPRYDEGTCSLVATTYKDQHFKFVDGACEKILRTWTVIDWCEYDEQEPTLNEGWYVHVQIIKLINEEGPTFMNCADTTVLTYGVCEGNVTFRLRAEDDCTEADELTYSYTIDIDNDDVADPIYNTNSDRINRVLPNGNHEVTWRVSDGCSNISTCKMILRVRDGKKPTPYCRGTVITATMNVSNGMVDIWASDFDLGSSDNCTPDSLLLVSFSQNTNDTRRVFTCDDIPDGEQVLIPLEMWVTDTDGNRDYCDVMVHLQDNESDMCDPEDGSNLRVSGTIETQLDQPIENVQVTVSYAGSNEPARTATTDDTGYFAATGLTADNSYSVTAYKNTEVNKGVNTLDIVKIQRHILGLEQLTNTYNLIAADANNDGQIKPSDLLTLRKLILGISTTFPNGQTSWRFLPSDYEFANANDPWPFDEEIALDNMQFSSDFKNMIAVKIGDVDNSYNGLQDQDGDIESRSKSTLTILVDNQEVSSGATVEVPVYANQKDLYAYQFTINLAGLSLASIEAGQLDMSAENMGVFDDRLTLSWNDTEGISVYADEPLFTLIFDATANTTMNDAMTISSDITAAVAFDSEGTEMGVNLEMRTDKTNFEEFTLFQNKPNPFTSNTEISFFLPAPQDVTLAIYDVTGKRIYSKRQAFSEGVQSFDIQNEELGASGILYYEVSAGPHKSTMKMISIK